jgi:3-oxoacyl-[acyl-carrier protein] reductase
VAVPSYDFSAHHVLITGGTRGLGLEAARAFAAAGAAVTVTGTASLLAYYDSDLSSFGYHQLDLTDGDEIASLASRVGPVDVLVNAAAPRLFPGLDDGEREFVAHAARIGLIGPLQLATRLRLRMSGVHGHEGGRSVVNLPAVEGWFGLAHDAPPAAAALAATTHRLGTAWARSGVRLNSITAVEHVPMPRSAVRVQIERHPGQLLTRTAANRQATRRQATHQQIIDVTLFLASAGAAGISGQTLPVGAQSGSSP